MAYVIIAHEGYKEAKRRKLDKKAKKAAKQAAKKVGNPCPRRSKK